MFFEAVVFEGLERKLFFSLMKSTVTVTSRHMQLDVMSDVHPPQQLAPKKNGPFGALVCQTFAGS